MALEFDNGPRPDAEPQSPQALDRSRQDNVLVNGTLASGLSEGDLITLSNIAIRDQVSEAATNFDPSAIQPISESQIETPSAFIASREKGAVTAAQATETIADQATDDILNSYEGLNVGGAEVNRRIAEARVDAFNRGRGAAGSQETETAENVEVAEEKEPVDFAELQGEQTLEPDLIAPLTLEEINQHIQGHELEDAIPSGVNPELPASQAQLQQQDLEHSLGHITDMAQSYSEQALAAGPAAAEREAGPQDRHGQETELQAETSPTFALT
ncbi:MAG: hypothetical protein D6719_01035, partial [Candidatus Dadabacteria bacterium]